LFTQTDIADIPVWVKNNAYWWYTNQIGDSDFVAGIEFLVEEGIIYIPESQVVTSEGSQEIPSWVRDIAGFWADDSISDAEFVQAIQWMITNGVMVIF